MKNKLIILLFVVVAIPGCVVTSFYPIYTPDDLVLEDRILGKWIDSDSTIWQVSQTEEEKSYTLKFLNKTSGEYRAHLIKINNNYFVNFALHDLDLNLYNFDLMHLMPIQTFARLDVTNDGLTIRWFKDEWLMEMIEKNEIEIDHVSDNDILMLTASPKEIQELLDKYGNAEEAYSEYTSNIVELSRF